MFRNNNKEIIEQAESEAQRPNSGTTDAQISQRESEFSQGQVPKRTELMGRLKKKDPNSKGIARETQMTLFDNYQIIECVLRNNVC